MGYIKVLLALLLAWILQIVLNTWQVQKFNKRFSEMRKLGDLSAIGTSGKYWKGRAFAILVCDGEGNIVASEYLSGFTVFSTLKPYSQLVGTHIESVHEDSRPLDLKKKIWAAFVHAAQFINKKLLSEE